VRLDRTAKRLIACTLLAVVWGQAMSSAMPMANRDFGQMWFAARTIISGGNPYAVIGPGKPFAWDWPWYYPLPAGLVAIPLAPLSQTAAIGVMSCLGAGMLAWALTATGWAPLLAFGSISVWQAFYLAQWSPLLASTLVVTPLAVLLVCKPTIGAALFIARPSWWAVVGGIVLLGLAFAVQPSWVHDWRDALASPNIAPGRKTVHTPPVLYAGGMLVLAALTRWRRPEARLLVAMACVPQTTLPYESVPLFLVPRGWVESAAFCALSWAMLAWVKHLHQPDMGPTVLNYGTALVWFMYLPSLVMVLRRPNEGPVPGWLEQRIAQWPAWIRGRATALQ
jgi:hypothetical protein